MYTYILSIKICDFSKSNINTKTSNCKKDFLKILVPKFVSKTNIKNKTGFVFSAKLNIEECKIFHKTMSGAHASE